MKLFICLFFAAVCFPSVFVRSFFLINRAWLKTHSFQGLIKKEAMEMLRKDQKHCVQLSGVSLDHLDMARLDRKIHEDEYQEKFAVCMLKKFRIMNTDGSISKNEPNYLLLTDNPESYEAARNCVALAGTNARESARKIMTCLMQTDIIVMDPQPSWP